MRSMPAYKKLDAWQLSMAFVEQCYKATASFPREELYGLTGQIRRAAVSIPANVAEGYCRRKTKVYAHHVSISLGSHGEVETCIELAHRLGFLSTKMRDTLDGELEVIGKLLSGLHRSLEEKMARKEAEARAPSATAAKRQPAPSP
jgi:four helix bundle protein